MLCYVMLRYVSMYVCMHVCGHVCVYVIFINYNGSVGVFVVGVGVNIDADGG